MNKYEQWLREEFPFGLDHNDVDFGAMAFKAGMMASAEIVGNFETYRNNENQTFFDTITDTIKLVIEKKAREL